MTDRYHTLTVVLQANIREDDAKPLMDAIQQMRGVSKVSGVVADINSHMAEERARNELKGVMLGYIYPKT